MKKVKTVDYEVIEVPVVAQNDTLISNELRFYKIMSAHNSMQLMFDEFGIWDYVLDGRYQNNVPQLVWENVTLPNTSGTFTISASGRETINDYFACLVIFDDKFQDALEHEYLNRQELIDFFHEKLQNLGSSKDFYASYERR